MKKNSVNNTILNTLIFALFILTVVSFILSIISIDKKNINQTILITKNSSLNWIELDFSPIYSPYNNTILDEDYYPFVIYDSLSFSGNGASFKYKMWHQSTNDTLAISYSNDGISWILANQTNLPSSFHACVLYSLTKFNNSSNFHYRIWYWIGSASISITAISTAESNDGIIWTNIQSITQDTNFPLVDGITPGLFYHLYGPSFIYYNPNSTNITGSPYTFPFVLFYDIASEGFGPGTSSEAIGLAYSLDGFFWIRYGIIPILIPNGCPGGFCQDKTHAFRPSLIIENNIYNLFYSCSNDNINIGLIYAHGICHAISKDGVTWSIDYLNPIFYFNNGKQWRNCSTYTPFVLNFNGTLVMWFNGGSSTTAGQNQSIGYAQCLNCL